MDLTGDEGSKIHKYKSPIATQQLSHLFPSFSSYKIYYFENKEKNKSFHPEIFISLQHFHAGPSTIIFLNFSESGQKDYLGKYIFCLVGFKEH